MPYYTATQSTIYIGETWADEIFGVRYRTNCNTTPYYGYASSKFDAVVRGKFLAEGEILVYYNKLRYFWTLLVENINSKVKTTPTEDASAQEEALDECVEKIIAGKDAAVADTVSNQGDAGEDVSSKARYEARREQLWGAAKGNLQAANKKGSVSQIKRPTTSGPTITVDSNTSETAATKTEHPECDLAACEKLREECIENLRAAESSYIESLTVEVQPPYDITKPKRFIDYENWYSPTFWTMVQDALAAFLPANAAYLQCVDRTSDEDSSNNTGNTSAGSDPTTGAVQLEYENAVDGTSVVIDETGTSAVVTAASPTTDPASTALSAVQSYLDRYPDGLAALSKKLLAKAIMKMSPNRSPILVAEETFKGLNDFLGVEIFKLSDIEIAGPFDIMVLTGVDGNSNLNSFRDEKTGTTPALICKLKDCFLTGKAQDIMQNDQLLFTAYTFFAREEL